MNKNITPTVEGGLLTAIAVVLGLSATYLPIAGIVIEFFCPVPFVVLTVRHGLKIGAISLIVSFILLSMFTTPIVAVRLALTMNLCGVVLGYCLSQELRAVQSFLATLLTSFFSQIILVQILMVIMDINFADMEISTLKETFEESFKVYESIGVEKIVIDSIRQESAKIVELVAYLIPLILFLLSLVNAAATYILSKWIFKKLNMNFFAEMPRFAEWRFPTAFAYLAAFTMIGLYWGYTRDWNSIYIASLNSLFFLMIAGIIEGFAVLSFVADKYNISKFWRRLLFILIILNSLLLQILAMTGIFDMLFDYRKNFFKS